MLLVGQRVDDVKLATGVRDDRGLLLRERANDQRPDPSLEVARDVLQRLANAFGELRGQMQRVAAELADGDFERGARAQRRLLEEQCHVQSGQRVRVV